MTTLSLPPSADRHRLRTRPSLDRAPVRVQLHRLPPVIAGGLVQLFAEHRDRFVVVPPHAPGRPGPGVAMVDPETVDPRELAELGARHVVALTWAGSSTAVRRARALGVRRVVDVGSSGPDLLRALDDVVAGRDPEPSPPPRTRSLLTHREGEVLTRVCAGLSNQEIAADLFLSINSIKTYVRTLYRKIGATRRSQAVLWGLEHGF